MGTRQLAYVRASFIRHRRRERRFVVDTAVHAIDTLSLIAGEVQAYAASARTMGEAPWADIQFSFASGVLATLDVLPDSGHVVEAYDLFGRGYRVLATVRGASAGEAVAWEGGRLAWRSRPSDDTESFLVNGTYAETNRLAMQVAEECNWVFPNVNVRPYYVEGSKTLAFEVCEQLNWNPPDHVIVPTGSGAMLCAISKGFDEFKKLDLIEDKKIKISCAQPYGSSPIVEAFKNGDKVVEPLEYPETVAKSLAIGDPGDGTYVLQRVRESGGYAESVTDKEIIEAIKLLAKTEGVFTEPAGGVAVAVLKKLVENGQISDDEKVVCYVTGNGLKTPEAIIDQIPTPIEIHPTLNAFKSALKTEEVTIWLK